VVERILGKDEVTGSNPVSSTTVDLNNNCMNDLLFLPLDIDITNAAFFRDGRVTYQQRFWHTENVVNVGNNYENYRWLLDQLSLDQITTFTYKTQLMPVSEHVDVFGFSTVTPEIQNLIENEPSGFHIVLKGNPDSLEIFDGHDWVNPILPSVPGIYLMNLTSCVHRVKPDAYRETLYIKGLVNKTKHKKLIETNLEKYRHLAIFKR
jgi:hypothetical protein